MKYVYGPVPSRRLGQSLGVDLIPLKTCNWNCIYCQLGRTRPVVNQRKSYTPAPQILFELREVLEVLPPDRVDWVTFVGSGEPTLHEEIGHLLHQVKGMTDKPVAVITNGALLHRSQVREDLLKTDAVLPSLDAGNPDLYRKINRPHPEITFQRLIDGLVSFREEYQGSLWLEIMLLQGVNTSEAVLLELADLLTRIQPDEVHLNTPIRPPAEIWVQPPNRDQILRAMAVLGERARVIPPVQGRFELGGGENLLERILGILTRHPLREDELKAMLLDECPGQVPKVLEALYASDRTQVVERYGVQFWSATPAFSFVKGWEDRPAD